jgi:DNA-directed RNA polymerase subunit RPC12/RpoP
MNAETKRRPVFGVLVGVLVGTAAGIAMMFLGWLLCKTGVGCVLGIPLYLAGLTAPIIVGVVGGLGAVQGICPVCGHKIVTLRLFGEGVTCWTCRQRLIVKGNRFIAPQAEHLVDHPISR